MPFVLRVFPAAFLDLTPGRYPQGTVLTVLDIDSGLPFKKTVGSGQTSVKVPARAVVPAVFRGESILELWRPIPLKAGQKFELQENPPGPKGRGQLAAVLVFPASGTAGGNQAVTVRWKGERGTVPPDVVSTGDPWRLTAFWFDLPAGEGTLEVESKGWVLEKPIALAVPDRGVGFAREAKVIPRPHLKARFEENERLTSGEADVELLDCRRLKGQAGPPLLSLCPAVSSRQGPVGGEFVFEGLAPVLYALRWKAGTFRDHLFVDLGGGVSKDLTIPVRICRVAGEVTRKGKPVAGTSMKWHQGGASFEAVSVADEDGHYEILLSPSDYVVVLDGPDFRRHAEMLDVKRDRDVDFVIPANRTEVKVVDAATGAPIPGAKVGWHLEAKGESHLTRAESVVSDDSGLARLPPFPPGGVSVVARARGYRISEPQKLDITKESASAELEIRLAKGFETRLRLQDANGNPIRGAWAMLPSGQRTEPSDEAGEVVFEEKLIGGDPVFATSGTGSLVLARYAGEDVPIRIGAPSRPFTVRFLAASGRPVASEQIQYAIDGVRVPQPMDYLARMAAGGDLSSKVDGALVVAGLPPSGSLTIWPSRKPEAVVTRPLPIAELLELPAP